MKKRFFSLTASLALLISACPIPASAESVVIDETAFNFVRYSSEDLIDPALWELGYGVLVSEREYAGIAVRAEDLSALEEIAGYRVGWIPDGEWSTSAEEYDVSLQTIGNSMTNWITLKMDPTVSGDKPISTVLDCDFEVNDSCIGVCNVYLKSGMTADERTQAKIDFCKAAAESDEVELLGVVFREADYYGTYSGVINVYAKDGMEYQNDILALYGEVSENPYEGNCSVAIQEIADAYAARDALMAEHSDWIENIELSWELAESTEPQGIGVAAEIVPFDTSAEETYLSLPAQLGELHLVEGADFLVDDIVAVDKETPSYYLGTDTPKGLYITQFCPTGCVDYTVGTRAYPMRGTYLAENKGALLHFNLQDQTAAKTFADEAFTALLGENYEIIAPDSDTQNHSVIIKESAEQAKAIADAVYAWATADHVVTEFSFSEAYISKYEISFAGPMYALDVYPDAKAKLSDFASEYASDWTVTASSSYCQLRPTAAETDHFQLMDMVKLVYDALGYIPHYAILEDDGAEKAINTVYYAPNLGDVNADGKVTVSDAIMLFRYVAEDTTVPITDAGIAVADLNADGNVNADDTTVLLKMLAGLAQ